MKWLQRLFDHRKTQNNQQMVDEAKMAHSTTMLKVVAEETIMAVARWMITIVNHSLQPKPVPPVEIKEKPVASDAAAVEKLVLKVSSLVEQVYERNQAMTALENRVDGVEKSLRQDDSVQDREKFSQLMATLENRLDNLEKMLEQGNPSTEKVDQNSQTITALENRIAVLEKLLARFSVIPNSVNKNFQAIVSLQSRLDILESSQKTNHNNNSHRSVAKVS